MEKLKKSKARKNVKPKQIVHSDEDALSSHSTLSINPDEPLVNNIAHHLFLLAIQQAREERQQAKTRQKKPKFPAIIPRQPMLMKKEKLTIKDIDRIFEEKRLRPSTIENDLLDLYQKSTARIRSMLDLHQIDQFLRTTENRKLAGISN